MSAVFLAYEHTHYILSSAMPSNFASTGESDPWRPVFWYPAGDERRGWKQGTWAGVSSLGLKPATPLSGIADGPHPEMAWLAPDTANRVGQVLVDQNRRSVEALYKERRYPWGQDEDVPYEFREVEVGDGWSVLKALASYEYQACETWDLERTEAGRIVQAIREWTWWRMVVHSDAYKSAEWQLDAGDVTPIA